MPVIVRGLAGGIKEVDINPILFNGVFTTFKMYVTYLCSEVKESACNAVDPGSIPGLGRSPGEGNGTPL